jgi:hypothetical protein
MVSRCWLLVTGYWQLADSLRSFSACLSILICRFPIFILYGSISIYAPESLTHLGAINPKRIGKAVVAKKKLRDLIEKMENLTTKGGRK